MNYTLFIKKALKNYDCMFHSIMTGHFSHQQFVTYFYRQI